MIKREEGFTLVELLIVIIILGILAVVGIPKFMNSRVDAELATCRTNRATLEDAVERFRFDNRNVPVNQADLVTGQYIKRAYVCPRSNTDTYTIDQTAGSTQGNVACTNGCN